MSKRDYFIRRPEIVRKAVLVPKAVPLAPGKNADATGRPAIEWQARDIDRTLPPHEQVQVVAWLVAHDCRCPEKRRPVSLSVRPRARIAGAATGGTEGRRRWAEPDAGERVARDFQRRIMRQPYLAKEEEAALLRSAQAGDIGARNKLWLAHMRKVVSLAEKTWQNECLETADKIGEGALAIPEAIGTWDAERGVPLSSHAKFPIKNAIRDYALGNVSPLREPRPQTGSLRFGGVAFDAPVHDTSGPAGTVGDRLAATAPESDVDLLGYHPSGGSARTPASAEQALLDGERDAELHDQQRLLRRALESLAPRERAIFTARCLADNPVKRDELATVYRISAERVRQIEARAREKVEGFILAAADEARVRLQAEIDRRRAVYRAGQIMRSIEPKQADYVEPVVDAGRSPSSRDDNRRARVHTLQAAWAEPFGRPVEFGWTLRLRSDLRGIAELRVAAHLYRRARVHWNPPQLHDRLGVPSLDLAALCGPAFVTSIEPAAIAA